jgi:hypothetical protein
MAEQETLALLLVPSSHLAEWVTLLPSIFYLTFHLEDQGQALVNSW